MIAGNGAISRPAVRGLWILGGLSVLLATAVGVGAPALAAAIAPVVNVEVSLVATLLVLAAALLGTLSVSGLVGTVALVRGRRFIPALAPAIPSTVGAVLLLAVPGTTVTELFAAICVGGLFQLALVAAAGFLPRPKFADAPPLSLGTVAVATAGLLLLLGLLPALQRVIAATIDPSGAAQFDYAARGIQVAQQLLIGGLLIAVLPEWSAKHSQSSDIRADFRNRLWRQRSCFSSLVPSRSWPLPRSLESCSNAVPSAHRTRPPSATSHGSWCRASSRRAWRWSWCRQCSPLDDLTKSFGSALPACSQTLLTVAFGLAWGAPGVAAAYSLSMLTAAIIAVYIATNVGVLDLRFPELRRFSWPDRLPVPQPLSS